MRKTLALTFIMGLAVAAVIGPASYAQDPNQRALRVNGATMASDEVQIWAIKFMQLNPDIRVVVAGSSVSKGFDDLFTGNVDLVTSGRDMSPAEQKKAAEKGISLTYKLIGYAAVAAITSPKNPINELTLDQLRSIFIGQYTNWKQVGGPDVPIRCLTRGIPESGGAVFFMQDVLRHQPYGSGTVVMDNWRSIVKVCGGATDLPIGIVPMRTPKGGAKILGIKRDENSPAVIPSEETLKVRSYPIINSIRLFWDGHTEDDRIRKFVDFCESEGLQIK